jgi:glycosyltransferase involved in cell wall biosynthesis
MVNLLRRAIESHRPTGLLLINVNAVVAGPNCTLSFGEARRYFLPPSLFFPTPNRGHEAMAIVDGRPAGRWWGSGRSKKVSVITRADRARDDAEWAQAARYYRVALRRNPAQPAIWIQCGHALKESGELAEAEKCYLAAISYSREDSDAHLHLGHVLKLQGKKDEAVLAYVKAAALGAGIDALEGLWTLGLDTINTLLYASNDGASPQKKRTRKNPVKTAQFTYDPIVYSLRDSGIHRELGDLTISAVIPLYNGAKYIVDAIRSVERQTLRPKELIVVDDGSTDKSAALVKALDCDIPLTLLRKKNGGQSSARNHGIRHSKGQFIALLDQDDIWYPHHLEKLAEPFLERRYPCLGWTYSNLDFIAYGRIFAIGYVTTVGVEHPKRSLLRCLGEDMHILPSASLILREAFDKAGGFDERLSGYEDDDLFLRLFCLGYGNVFLDEPLSQWRQHGANAGGSPRMAKSRMVYMRKLVEAFPDDDMANLHYTRDIIAPRFAASMIDQYCHAIALGDAELSEATIDHLSPLNRYAPSAVPGFVEQARSHRDLVTKTGDLAQIAGMNRLLQALLSLPLSVVQVESPYQSAE